MTREREEAGVQKRTVELGGRLGLETAQELKDLLLKVLGETDHMAIALGSESEVDVTFLQIVCATHAAALGSGKHLSFENRCGRPFVTLLEQSGYALHGRCPHEAKGECLWKRETSP